MSRGERGSDVLEHWSLWLSGPPPRGTEMHALGWRRHRLTDVPTWVVNPFDCAPNSAARALHNPIYW